MSMHITEAHWTGTQKPHLKSLSLDVFCLRWHPAHW